MRPKDDGANKDSFRPFGNKSCDEPAIKTPEISKPIKRFIGTSLHVGLQLTCHSVGGITVAMVLVVTVQRH